MPDSATDHRPEHLPEHLLIVEAQPANTLSPELFEQLATATAVDIYTLRQRLTGYGLAQLTATAKPQLRDAANLLRRAHIRHWLLQADTSAPLLPTITNLSFGSDQILFQLGERREILEKGSTVLAVVADLSGQLAEKQLKRLLVHTTYTGQRPAAFDDNTLHHEIFRLTPVIDLYWHSADRCHAVRILPGTFDHRQLGEQAQLSQNRNLAALFERLKDYAQPLLVDRRFGLGFLPTRGVQRATDERGKEKNLLAFSRYSALLHDIHFLTAADGEAPPGPIAQSVPELAGALLAPLTDPGTAIAANDAAATISAPEEDEHPALARPPLPQPAALPPPPPLNQRSGLALISTPWRWLALGLVPLIAAVAGFSDSQNLPPLIEHYGLRTGAIPALLGIGCGWGAFYYWQLKRRIETTPTSRARSVAQGMVEIQGRAKRAYALVAPISQQPCAYYRLKKFQRKPPKNQWQLTQLTDSSSVPFLLEDESGSIRIDPHGAHIRPATVHHGIPGQSGLLFERISSANADADEKWQEEVIYEGSPLYVLGFARAAHDSTPGLRQRIAEKLQALKTDPQALRRYDRNGDGNIDNQEWDQARDEMEQLALHEKLHHQPHRHRAEIGRPPLRGLPFVIAETTSQAHLTRSFGWRIPLLLSATLACLIWALLRASHFFLHH